MRAKHCHKSQLRADNECVFDGVPSETCFVLSLLYRQYP